VGLKEDLLAEVATIFRSTWTERDGTVVPTDDSIKLTNDAVKLTATVLYADMADSTKMVDNSGAWSATETYKTFLHCSAKIIRSQGGTITAYDGDRIMAVFIGDSKNTSAVRAALKIKWAVSNIINPAKKKQYAENVYPLKHVVGIDTSELFVANAGVRGAKDLVWVGRAANHAAKLSSLPPSFTYITAAVYNKMHDEAKLSSGINMWEPVKWNTFDNQIIYRSSYHWEV
jgi:class 3 adenylate cyclase